MNKKLFYLTILLFIITSSIQIYHVKYDGDIKYICNSFGQVEQRPFLTILWVIITLVGSYILSNSPKISKDFLYLYKFCIILLIISSNFDYKYRNDSSKKLIFRLIHYFLTIVFFSLAFYLFHTHIHSKIIVLFYFKFIAFCILHLTYHLLKTKPKIIKYFSTLLELLLFFILSFSVLIKISLNN